MKQKRASILLLFALTCFLVSAQNWDNSQMNPAWAAQLRALAALNLTDAEKEQIGTLFQDLSARQQQVQAELNVRKAELERLLVQPAGQVEQKVREARRILQESVQYRVELELISIEARLRLEEILGAQRFARYNTMLRRIRNQAQ